nr:ATP-dependent helicase [Candidatus Paceibacterota bacterium]
MKNSKNDLFDAFSKAYNNLNPEQRLAVDTTEGPVMVIAGPGTGKTQILTLRIANILLKTDTRPENILALTFTDSGVRAMRNRLTSFIGADAYNVPIHTFHSFAGDLIRKYPDAYENIVGGRPASELEKRKIIEDLLEDEKYKRIRPHGDPSFYVKPILDAISTLKKEYIPSEKFSQSIEIQIQNLDEVEKFHTKGAHKGKVRGEYQDLEKMLERNQELLHIYQRYNAKMRALRLFDFEDMILDTISSLEKNQDMLFDTQEQYQYILADEHQDVNQSQNRLIEIISNYHESPNVFVVGDEKQAIFRFQGASLENFLFFEDIYKSAKIIALTSNYRSDQKILDLAHESISTDDPELKKLRIPLKAEKQYEVILSKQSFSHRAIEDSWVVDQIKKHHASGVSFKEMAIIVHTNKEIQQLATLLRKEKIPVSPSSDNDILEHPIFIAIKNLMRAVAEVDNEVILAEVLQAPYWNINNNDLVLVLMSRSFSNRLSKIIGNESSLKDIGVENVESFLRVDRVLQSARADSVIKTPAEVLEKLLQESGLLDFALRQTIYDSTRVVRRLYDEVES